MTDRFRKQYVPLSDGNALIIGNIKRLAEAMEAAIGSDKSRELSLALTKLEEAVFWATKHYSNPERQ